MAEGIFILPVNHPIALPVDAADRLIREGDGAAALLYIYILRCGGRLSVPDAAAALGRTVKEIKLSFEKLRALALVNEGVQPEDNRPLEREEPPEYTAKDVEQAMNGETKFAPLVHEVQQLMGKILSSGDLLLLFGIYDYLGLPAEVILLLVGHCIEEYRAKFGEGKVPTMRTIEKAAYVWSKKELFTLERAEEYIRYRQEYKSRESQLRRALGITNRALSRTEVQYAESWFTMGFDIDCISAAYDRTVLKTGRLSWAYMNSILCSWDSKGLHSIREINESNSEKRNTGGTMKDKGRPESHIDDEVEQLRRELQRMNGEES